VEFQESAAEDLPVPDGWADVVISNRVLNLTPDKAMKPWWPQTAWSAFERPRPSAV
jgi:hypothetical protein